MQSESSSPRARARVDSAERMELIGSGLGQALREDFANSSNPSDAKRAVIVYLQGPLGAGKTTFARGVLRAFGVTGAVKSPTYTLVEPYSTAFGPVAHFDFYRLAGADEVEYLGMREYLDHGVCLFEWPERARGGLPPADLQLEITFAGSRREIRVAASSAPGARLLANLVSRDLLQESIPNT